MTSSRNDAIERLRDAATRVAGSHGLEVFDVQVRRESVGRVLRVIIDRPSPVQTAGDRVASGPGPEPVPGPVPVIEEPVGIVDCQRVSQDLGALLDVEDALTADLGEDFTLEVSSPGLDRPLRGEADYRRFVGRLAKIVTREPVAGQSHFAGRLAGVEGDTVLLTEGRRTHRVPLDRISRARLEVEF